MPRAIIFGDLIGMLDALWVECLKCQRPAQYRMLAVFIVVIASFGVGHAQNSTATDVVRLYPTFEGVSLANMIDDNAITELSNVVRARTSGKQFGLVVQKVIDTCNKCHEQTHRAFIKVTTPIDRPKP